MIRWYCIYRITNLVNGHSYIGQHMYTNEANPMGKYKGSGLLLKLAYKKYGRLKTSKKLKGRSSPTKGMRWYKTPDEKQYGMFRVCPDGWIKTNPREVNERLRKGK